MMLAELEETTLETLEPTEEEAMPSLNHSFICNRILRQLFENQEIEAMPELTLSIGKGITPDISVYQREKIRPDFLQDFAKFSEIPLLAIEVISASQNIQDLLDKSRMLIANGVQAVWTVEPFTNTIFVTTNDGVQRFPSQVIASVSIEVDFRRIFATS